MTLIVEEMVGLREEVLLHITYYILHITYYILFVYSMESKAAKKSKSKDHGESKKKKKQKEKK